MKRIDITGNKFGELTVIKKTTNATSGKTRWLCICDCGKFSKTETYKLTSGHSKTCGCSKNRPTNKTHGFSSLPEYKIWDGIIQRTTNEKCSSYNRYGGRGIDISEDWKLFVNFYRDMGDRPSPLFTIERIDNNKGYTAKNCKWDTRKNQARNRRTNVIIEIDGVSKVLAQWLEELNVCRSTFYKRRKKGMTHKESLGL